MSESRFSRASITGRASILQPNSENDSLGEKMKRWRALLTSKKEYGEGSRRNSQSDARNDSSITSPEIPTNDRQFGDLLRRGSSGVSHEADEPEVKFNYYPATPGSRDTFVMSDDESESLPGYAVKHCTTNNHNRNINGDVTVTKSNDSSNINRFEEIRLKGKLNRLSQRYQQDNDCIGQQPQQQSQQQLKQQSKYRNDTSPQRQLSEPSPRNQLGKKYSPSMSVTSDHFNPDTAHNNNNNINHNFTNNSFNNSSAINNNNNASENPDYESPLTKFQQKLAFFRQQKPLEYQFILEQHLQKNASNVASSSTTTPNFNSNKINFNDYNATSNYKSYLNRINDSNSNTINNNNNNSNSNSSFKNQITATNAINNSRLFFEKVSANNSNNYDPATAKQTNQTNESTDLSPHNHNNDRIIFDRNRNNSFNNSGINSPTYHNDNDNISNSYNSYSNNSSNSNLYSNSHRNSTNHHISSSSNNSFTNKYNKNNDFSNSMVENHCNIDNDTNFDHNTSSYIETHFDDEDDVSINNSSSNNNSTSNNNNSTNNNNNHKSTANNNSTSNNNNNSINTNYVTNIKNTDKKTISPSQLNNKLLSDSHGVNDNHYYDYNDDDDKYYKDEEIDERMTDQTLSDDDNHHHRRHQQQQQPQQQQQQQQQRRSRLDSAGTTSSLKTTKSTAPRSLPKSSKLTPTTLQRIQGAFTKISQKVFHSEGTPSKKSHDEKIIEILLTKKEKEERERKEREEAHRQWEAERADLNDFKRRNSYGGTSGRRDGSKPRTLFHEKQQANKQSVEQKLEQQRQEFEEYQRQLRMKHESDFQRVNSLRASKSQQNLLKTKLKSLHSEQKQEVINQQSRKSMENLSQLKKNIDAKLQLAEQNLQMKKKEDSKKSRDDLRSRAEQSRLRVLQLEEEMKTYQVELQQFNEKQIQHADYLAKMRLAEKKEAACRERLDKERVHRANYKKLLEEEDKRNAERERIIANKDLKVELMMKEKQEAIARNRAKAQASQMMREQIRNSSNLQTTVKKLNDIQDKQLYYQQQPRTAGNSSGKSSENNSLLSSATSPSYLLIHRHGYTYDGNSNNNNNNNNKNRFGANFSLKSNSKDNSNNNNNNNNSNNNNMESINNNDNNKDHEDDNDDERNDDDVGSDDDDEEDVRAFDDDMNYR